MRLDSSLWMRVLGVALAATLAAGCPDEDEPGTDTTSEVTTDVVSDTESEVTPDAEADSEPDAEPETIADVEPETIADVAPETIADVEPETIADVAPETIADVEPETIADVEPETIADVEPETIADVEPETITDAGPDSTPDIVDDVDLPPLPPCSQLCGEYYDDTTSSYCDPGTPFATAWPTAADCEIACENASSNKLPFAACMFIAGSACGDPTSCGAAPATPTPGCGSTCDALQTLCGSALDGLDSPFAGPFCQYICSAAGYYLGLDSVTPTEGTACIEGLSQCPYQPPGGDDGPLGAAVLTCSAVPTPDCVATCDQLDACGAFTGGGDGPADAEECYGFCTLQLLTDPTVIEQITTCVGAAGDVCNDVLACVPQGG